jgi:hypothetical protein
MPLNIPGFGKVLQVGYAETSTKSSTSSAIPADGSIPQIGEGTQFLSLNFTPKRPDSTLHIVLQGLIFNDDNSIACVALFKNGGANAIGVNFSRSNSESMLPPLVMRHVPGSVSPITFTARYGSGSGNTYLNGYVSPNGMGGLVSSLTVIEVAP